MPITRELLAPGDIQVDSVGVSGMGPCTLLVDAFGEPLRPAILYGVDTRASGQIATLEDRFGAQEILDRSRSLRSSPAVGPKLLWVAERAGGVRAGQEALHAESWLVWNLTGEYVFDTHSASQCTPFVDAEADDWYRPWADAIAPALELPALRWPGDRAGAVTAEVAAATGLPIGTPVITGTIDAWSEAVSVGAQTVGDLILMYGTTMFLINTVDKAVHRESMWGTVGAFRGTKNLAGGMATSGAITGWLRAPIMDPDARGVVAGLTLRHNRGDLYHAALEATAFGVRHNIETMVAASATIQRITAAGAKRRGGFGLRSSRTSRAWSSIPRLDPSAMPWRRTSG
ncbi:MAG: FGGY family carbohydrate kinase [Homoserinimonas sp.]